MPGTSSPTGAYTRTRSPIAVERRVHRFGHAVQELELDRAVVASRCAACRRSRARRCAGCGSRSPVAPHRRGRCSTPCNARSSRRSPPCCRTRAPASPAARATMCSWSQYAPLTRRTWSGSGSVRAATPPDPPSRSNASLRYAWTTHPAARRDTRPRCGGAGRRSGPWRRRARCRDGWWRPADAGEIERRSQPPHRVIETLTPGQRPEARRQRGRLHRHVDARGNVPTGRARAPGDPAIPGAASARPDQLDESRPRTHRLRDRPPPSHRGGRRLPPRRGSKARQARPALAGVEPRMNWRAIRRTLRRATAAVIVAPRGTRSAASIPRSSARWHRNTLEVLVEMPQHVVVVATGGQNVDEAEQLRLEVGVRHRPAEHLLAPPSEVETRRTVARRPRPQDDGRQH